MNINFFSITLKAFFVALVLTFFLIGLIRQVIGVE